MQQQIDRAEFQITKEDTSIRKYGYLHDLQDRNETLFHRVRSTTSRNFAPIVYAHGVGRHA